MKSYRAHVRWGGKMVEGVHGPLNVSAHNNIEAITITIAWCQRRGVENVTSIKVEEV